jgi:hypothetical protein
MLLSLFRAEGADDRSVFGDFWFEPIGARSSTGLRVSGDAALRLTAVYACVRILAETMACLPLCIYRPRADGGRDVQKDHWLGRLMKQAQPLAGRLPVARDEAGASHPARQRLRPHHRQRRGRDHRAASRCTRTA